MFISLHPPILIPDNGIEHFKTMNDFKKKIAEHKEITVDDLMDRNENGTCFVHYDLNDEVLRDMWPFLRIA